MPDAIGGYCGDYNVFAKWYWTVGEDAAGWYEIAAWFPPESAAPERVKYKEFAGNTCLETSSQKVELAGWVSIGVFPFLPGGGALRLANVTEDPPRTRRVIYGPIRLAYVPECEAPTDDGLGLGTPRCADGVCIELALLEPDLVGVSVRTADGVPFPAPVALELIDESTDRAIAWTELTACDGGMAPLETLTTTVSMRGREGVVRFHARLALDCGRGPTLTSPSTIIAVCRAACPS